MSLRNRVASVLATVALAGGGIVLPAVAANAAPAPNSNAAAKAMNTQLPVTGTMADGTVFNGTVSDLTTSVVDGVMQLTGTISGTGLPADGTTFAAPIEQVTAVGDGCQVLNLDLGPLHLDLLGLVIDLAPVNLDITAVPGAGNLLGNLVCAVAGLLDGNGPLQGISALLNRLLTGLGL